MICRSLNISRYTTKSLEKKKKLRKIPNNINSFNLKLNIGIKKFNILKYIKMTRNSTYLDLKNLAYNKKIESFTELISYIQTNNLNIDLNKVKYNNELLNKNGKKITLIELNSMFDN